MEANLLRARFEQAKATYEAYRLQGEDEARVYLDLIMEVTELVLGVNGILERKALMVTKVE